MNTLVLAIGIGIWLFIGCKKEPVPVASYGSLWVTVQDINEQPIAAASLTLAGEDTTFTADSDRGGRYTFVDVPVGNYRLSVNERQYLGSSLEVTITKNHPATATVTLVRRDPQIKLIDHTNGSTPLDDSLYFVFDKKITLNYIKTDYPMCTSNNPGFRYIEDNHGFKIKYTCPDLGWSHNFEYSVTDEAGNTLIDTVEISLYTHRFSLQEESIPNMVVADDNKHVWLTTVSDNGDRFRLLKIDLESFEVKIDVPIPDVPTDLTINPYNNLIYICSGYDDPSGYNDPSIFVFDPENGQLIKTIKMEGMPVDPELEAYIYPSNLTFTRSGFGVLNVEYENTSGTGWKILDSSKNDTIYYHEDVDQASISSGVHSPQLINDKKSIIGYWDSRTVIIDGETKKITDFQAPASGGYRESRFFVNKLNNTVFASGWNGILFDVKTGWVSDTGYPSLNPWGFTYRKNEDYYLFGILDGERLVLYDYENGEEVFSYPASMEFFLKDNTSDGKYYLLATATDLYLFNQQMFSVRGRSIQRF